MCLWLLSVWCYNPVGTNQRFVCGNPEDCRYNVEAMGEMCYHSRLLMVFRRSTTGFDQIWLVLRPNNHVLWAAVAMLLAAVLYLSTFQTHINGSDHPYATDVGEIQNALPRWGLIHHSGYPQYTALGSLFVTLLRGIGVPPAAATSLFSLLWGVVTVGLLVILAMDVGAPGPFAALGTLAFAISTSVWIDASLAEVHTMTLALTTATLIFALRFGRDGRRSDLLWLTFCFSQGVFHQRSVALLVPAAVILIWPHLLTIFRLGWRTVAAVIAISLLAPLTYLYLPVRVWTGADWVFGSPATWDGFWMLFFDNRADRIFAWQQSGAEWLARLRITWQILADDMPIWLLLLGLAGLLLPAVEKRRFRESLGLTLAWLPNLIITVLIWRNRVVDAQLAAKLPLLLLAGVGLALILDWLWRRSRPVAAVASAALLAILLFQGWQTRPFVLSITRDRSVEAIVEAVEQVELSAVGRRATILVPWGGDYWALTYAQAFEGRLDRLRLVDHNADPRTIIEQLDRLLLPNQTLYIFPLSYWEDLLGPLYLATAAPGVVEVSPFPVILPNEVPAEVNFDLQNGLRIRQVEATWPAADRLLLTVYWEVVRPVADDYSVAVHLVAQDPPQSERDILAQADKAHPVEGWYPTSRWRLGEIIRDRYLLPVPPDSSPVAVRISLYRSDPAAGFVNTPWLSLPFGELTNR